MNLLTLPSEIRFQIWEQLFRGIDARPSKLPGPQSEADYCEPCLDLLFPPDTLPFSTTILPLLTCRQIYAEALPYLYANITLHLHSEPSLQPFVQPVPPPLASRLHHLTLTTHVDIDNCILWHDTLNKLFRRLASTSATPPLSLKSLSIHHHMQPPSSYEHLQLGIFYMSPLIHLRPTSPPRITLHFAYRADYTLFTSPFLGEVRCSDAIAEHELVLRELRDDTQFRDGATQDDEQEMAVALERVARRHERTWLRGLQRSRMHLLSEEMRREVERALAEVEAEERREEQGAGEAAREEEQQADLGRPWDRDGSGTGPGPGPAAGS